MNERAPVRLAVACRVVGLPAVECRSVCVDNDVPTKSRSKAGPKSVSFLENVRSDYSFNLSITTVPR